MNDGLKKYQEEQRAKKAAAAAKLKEGNAAEKIDAKAEAEAAAEKAVADGAIKCARCGLVFDKSAAKKYREFNERLGCPECGFPIPQQKL